MKNIFFIGMGNMGSAIAKALNEIKLYNLFFTRKDKAKALAFEKENNIKYIEDLEKIIDTTNVIVLAIKPQVYPQILEKIKNIVTNDHIIISLAPGITISSLKNILNTKKIVRAMPNMGAVISNSMTGISYEECDFLEDEIKLLNTIFDSFGKYLKVEEKNMEAVVCMSGSSPAYIYTFIDELSNNGLKLGLKKEEALKLVCETMIGSAKLVLKTNEHPIILRDKICSPAGTTISGLMALEENGFSKAIKKANDACYTRCIELSKI